MAIVFPRDLPSYSMTLCFFTLDENISSAPYSKGARMNMSRTIDPMWKGQFKTGLLDTMEKRLMWSAWKKSLQGGLKNFYAYDVTRKTLLAYPNAKQPQDISAGWNGTCGVSSVGLSGALGLSGLPAGVVLSAGDRVGLRQSAAYGYYEILETVAANGAGAATVTVAPFLHQNVFTTAATAVLWRPQCLFKIDWQSWVDDGNQEPAPRSFEAWQILQ